MCEMSHMALAQFGRRVLELCNPLLAEFIFTKVEYVCNDMYILDMYVNMYAYFT